jgi:hypothetical protein
MREWVTYICTISPSSPSCNIELSPVFATAVVITVGKSWDSVPEEDKKSIISLLSRKRCMPTTKCGLKYPKDTYLPTVKVLPDLPLITTMKAVKGQFLDQLGVRKVVELQLVFDRLGHGGSWSHLDGIRYLSSVRKLIRLERKANCSDLKPEELMKLKQSPLCPSSCSTTRMRLMDLYEPDRDLEKLQLPILDWPKGVMTFNSRTYS